MFPALTAAPNTAPAVRACTMPPILLSSEKLPADTYLDGISPTAMPTLYYWINFHRAQHKGMHGNVEQALCLSFYKFRSTASCQLLASSLLCHTSTLWPESSPYVLYLWNCSVVDQQNAVEETQNFQAQVVKNNMLCLYLLPFFSGYLPLEFSHYVMRKPRSHVEATCGPSARFPNDGL